MEAELKKAKESVSIGSDIPAEYLSISDPNAHLEVLQRDLKNKQGFREAALTAKTTAASKLESCYGRRFTSKRELVQMIRNYIRYYNTRRVQRSLGILTQMEKYGLFSCITNPGSRTPA